MKQKPDNPNRLYPKYLLKPVSVQFFKALKDSIQNAIESELSSYNYEVKYVVQSDGMLLDRLH